MVSELDSLRGKVVLVTGAGGYLGREIVKALLHAGCAAVRAVDVQGDAVSALAKDCGSRVTPLAGSITDDEAMEAAVAGMDGVIHVASYGMSGPAMLDTATIRRVNIGGTLLLLKASAAANVAAFVYTSSYNVVFGGQPIVDGDEDTCPYFPPGLQVDEYSRTKTIAEQAVLSPNPKCRYANLKRCAIRPAAIFGPHEDRHMPRIVDLVRRGLVKTAIGRPDTLVDWVYIDNLVSAHLLALANLMSPQPTAHLEAFCISDDHPVNQFEFLAPLLVAVGGTRLTWFIPTALMLYVAFVLEWLYSFPSCRRIFNVIPLLTRAEVNKVGVTHYFEMTKARRLLNYSVLVPHPVGMERTAARWAGRFKAEQQRHPPAGSMGGVLWVLVIGIAACLAFARWLCI